MTSSPSEPQAGWVGPWTLTFTMRMRGHDVQESLSDPAAEIFDVLWAAHYECSRLGRRRRPDARLTQLEDLALHLIGDHPGLSLGDLATLLRRETQEVSLIVGGLAKRGLLARRLTV